MITGPDWEYWRAQHKAAQAQAQAQEQHSELLAKATDPTLRAVLKHHAPVKDHYRYPYCSGCDCGAYAIEDPPWPCSTIDLIRKNLGE